MRYFSACVAGLLLVCQGVSWAGELAGSRKHEIIRLLRQDCGSCHGLTLRGGLGPALLPETLREKDREGLQLTILFGRPGTAMPPWQKFLTQEEAAWLVDQLVAGVTDAQ